MFHSTYPQSEIDKEVEVICEEIESYNDSPAELIYDEFENMVFCGHPLGHNILGQAERLRNYTTDDARRFTSRLYRPDNAIFFAYGDIDFTRLVKALERAGHDSAPSHPPLTDMENMRLHRLPEYRPERKTIHMDTHLAHVMTGNRAYDIHDNRRMALYLLNNIMGGPGMTARLNLTLRERHALVYTVESSMASYSDTGVWAVYFGCDPAQTDRCMRLVRRELDRMADTQLSDRQLNAAKKQIKGQIGVACDSRENFAIDFAKSFLHYGWEKDVARLFRNIDAVTPQMIRRLKSTFGSRLAVQHSALNNTERLLQWRMIQQGNADIVVGTRSAVFAPLQNLGLIIMDEEQEHTYQSESAPRFDAHDVAKKRAVMENALLLFASATPLTETYHAAESGKLQLVQLTHRYGGRPLPSVDFIDMRAELAAGNPREVSVRLARELQENLDNGEQSILLLNRRGYRTIGMCTTCGHVLKCPNCSVPLVYHKPQQALLCHHCGHTVHPLPQTCPECGGKISYSGFGTQRVEEELAELLPGARILRMDQDSTSRKDAHETMLAQFARHEYDILLGTQMVAKGLDFEKVTLVGVLGIDSLLFGQGFRAYESVFSLITQVVGRGGRAALPGRALIQTSVPDHPVLQLAAAQDYKGFYREEITFRRFSLYPPFCSFVVVGFIGDQEGAVFIAAQRFGALLGQHAAQKPNIPLRILGPAPMNITMLNNKFRYKLTLKCRNDAAFRALLHETLDAYDAEKLPQKASVILDFNSDGDL